MGHPSLDGAPVIFQDVVPSGKESNTAAAGAVRKWKSAVPISTARMSRAGFCTARVARDLSKRLSIRVGPEKLIVTSNPVSEVRSNGHSQECPIELSQSRAVGSASHRTSADVEGHCSCFPSDGQDRRQVGTALSGAGQRRSL